MMDKTIFLVAICSAVVFMCFSPDMANAAGFGEYEGGILKIEPPRTIRIYKKGSNTSKSINIGSSEYTIRDARWQGSEIVVTLLVRSGKQAVRLYRDTTSFRTM